MTSYRILAGIEYGKEGKRAEPGDVVADLPKSAIPWLIECGAIEAVEEVG